MSIMSDSYSSLRQGAASWISSADTKATALIAVGAGLLTVIAAVLAATGILRTMGTLGVIVFIALGASSVVSLVAACAVLFPRLDRRKLLEKGGWSSPLDRSPSFFADVATLRRDEFEKLITDPVVIERDHQEQAYVLARIAMRKMHLLRWSVGALAVALILLMILLALMVHCTTNTVVAT